MTKCVVLSTEDLLSGAQCFCLDCDSGTVWVATRSDLCCIEGDKVGEESKECFYQPFQYMFVA